MTESNALESTPEEVPIEVEPPAESHESAGVAPVPEFVTVAPATDFAEGKGKAFKVEGKEVAVFRIGEEFHVISNACPHYGAQLCEGFVRNGTVLCPWHGWQFDIKTGKGMTMVGRDVKSFEVKVEDGQVKVATAEMPAL